MEVDIHNMHKRVQCRIAQIKRSTVFTDEDKALLFRYYDSLVLDGVRAATVSRTLDDTYRIFSKIGKPIASLTTEDIKEYVRGLELSSYATWTKVGRKIALKRFYKWYKGGDDQAYPDEVKWLKATVRRSNQKRVSSGALISPGEYHQLLDAAGNARNRALIACLFESGCRIGEIGSLTLGDVHMDTHGAILSVSGKTGARRVRLVGAASYLAMWLQEHPRKGDSSAALWVGMRHGMQSYGVALQYCGIRSMLKTVCKRAGVEKRVYFHLFRHTRATALAGHLTEAQLNAYFGWRQGSVMPSTYVHLNSKDLDAALFSLYGLTPQQEKKSVSEVKTCTKCKYINASEHRYCFRCGSVLDVAELLRQETDAHAGKVAANFSVELFKNALQDREVMQIIETKLQRGEITLPVVD